ncbi:carboxylesterase [Colletotrichum truncatum]|uniref:Carboxylesterase n=1 Tax=Colletotrichum truncatum TaxID=5467 RepID=A0ACC3ZB15_COLTU|nr:carboxylesterase [Colletotrichum truncatum]KAF6781033.1 carboxylesterase [Colletotrichum truncatum]
MRAQNTINSVLKVVAVASSLAAATPVLPRWTVGEAVETSSGPVEGHAASGADQVSEYLGIPYAQPPVGNLRFQPPAKYTGSSTINGSSFGHQCMQPSSGGVSLDAIKKLGVPASAAVILQAVTDTGSQSEDCLTLNVWTKPQTGDAKKAVLVWIHGGAFTTGKLAPSQGFFSLRRSTKTDSFTGSSRTQAYNGKFIADLNDVVVVSMNYRLNVFGFPGNPATAPNLGLLDIRLALEWVRDNVAKFGGDTERITIFGQSAGGSLVDYYSYAYESDPIANGFIPMSGVANAFGIFTNETVNSKWFKISSALGCGDSKSDAKAVTECMLTKTAQDIISNGLDPKDSGLGSSGGLAFAPVVDNALVFADYSGRPSAAGGYLVGNLENEAGLFKLGAPDNNETYWLGFNNIAFTCPTGRRAARAAAAGHPTWRYRYFGDFPNIAITTTPPSGAWHASELPVLFGTVPEAAIKNTPQEVAIGKYLRGAWAAFAKDTKAGLLDYNCHGPWPQYKPNDENTLNRIGFQNETGSNLAPGGSYDGLCAMLGVPTNN